MNQSNRPVNYRQNPNSNHPSKQVRRPSSRRPSSKKKGLPNWAYIAIAGVALIALVVALVNLLEEVPQEIAAGIEYNDIQQYGPGKFNPDQLASYGPKPKPGDQVTPDIPGIPSLNSLSVDFDSLKKINKDTVGWIIIDNEAISYPIVQGKDNSYYISYTFEKKRNNAGAIFLDYQNSSDFSDKNNVVYGHNMKNGSMFNIFTKYESQKYFDEHKSAYLITPSETFKLEIFAVNVLEAEEKYRERKFKTDTAFMDFVNKYQSRSMVKNDVSVTVKDRIVTFSTCERNYHEYTDGRLAVMAKMVPFDPNTNSPK